VNKSTALVALTIFSGSGCSLRGLPLGDAREVSPSLV
jgi:hypothetical protein